jgi:hypothetical protein
MVTIRTIYTESRGSLIFFYYYMNNRSRLGCDGREYKTIGHHLGILDLFSRRKAVYLYKILNNHIDCPDTLFRLKVPTKYTQQQSLFHKNTFRTNYGLHRLWNEFPLLEMVGCNLTSFQDQLKRVMNPKSCQIVRSY